MNKIQGVLCLCLLLIPAITTAHLADDGVARPAFCVADYRQSNVMPKWADPVDGSATSSAALIWGLRASEWTLDLYGLRNTGIHGTYGLIWMANAAFGSIVRCDATKATNAAR
ncbi:hypothetical protein [Burkholderia ubonensis]|uniref:Uncharacterized protein n=2 Tax=Burkholderia ubonensis TaxID=101571 RepID=A0A119XAP2_9BURK|nr:hypothetical protein [Burkholderia ubonensis]KVS52080.1 hypothetical protein WK37_01800 [Burkholderia ubonensis]KVS54752.1 hypothetical protein WK38_07285 [Burkholderia ubonensis]KVS77444.1 hypothetical protein WK42_17110 [Burkholderia ubonensis]KVS80862.1 hypothetical protein WK44_28865 [Burkholderia ubonensis]KVS89353.1 hypothetical protein WK45_24440 [Burkholderia ubonensis]